MMERVEAELTRLGKTRELREGETATGIHEPRRHVRG
jgi:hypothetical protein